MYDSIHTVLLASSPQAPNIIYLGTNSGIAKSTNYGDSWQLLVPSATYFPTKDGWYASVLQNHDNFTKSIWGGIDNISELFVHPNDPNLLLFTDDQDLYVSRDAALHWESLTFDYGEQYDDWFAHLVPKNRYKNKITTRGIQNTVSNKIVTDPFNPDVYYAAYDDLGLEISKDGGTWWEHPVNGLPSRGNVWSVAVNPKQEGEVWCSISGKRKIDDVWSNRELLYKSSDFGANWHLVFDKDDNTGRVTSITLDNNDSIYITTKYDAVYRAKLQNIALIENNASQALVNQITNKNWVHLTDGLEEDSQKTTSLVIDRNDSKILYLGTYDGIYKSTDYGKAWVRIVNEEYRLGRVDGLSISHDGTLFFSASNHGHDSYYDDQRRLWKLTSNAEFSDITPSLMKHNEEAYAGAIAVNPHDSNYLYAATFRIALEDENQKMALVRSKDGGNTWEDIGNNTALNRVTNIFIDENNPQHLFIHNKFGVLELWDSEAPVAEIVE